MPSSFQTTSVGDVFPWDVLKCFFCYQSNERCWWRYAAPWWSQNGVQVGKRCSPGLSRHSENVVRLQGWETRSHIHSCTVTAWYKLLLINILHAPRKIYFLYLHENIQCLTEVLLMRAHPICFLGEMRKTITWYYLLTGAMTSSNTSEVAKHIKYTMPASVSFSPFRWFKKGSCQFLAKDCAQYWLTA